MADEQQAIAPAQHIRNQKAELEGKLGQAQQQRTQDAKQDLAKRIEETRQHAAKNIKGWSPDLDAKILGFIKERNVPSAIVARNFGPAFYELMHAAYLGSELIKNQAAPPKPAPVVQPLTTVGGKGNPTASRSLAELAKGNNMDAFAKSLVAKMDQRAGRKR
jgi:hypothetical protein